MSDDLVSSSASHQTKNTAFHRQSRLYKLTSSANVSSFAKAPWRVCVAFVTKLRNLRKAKSHYEPSSPVMIPRRYSGSDIGQKSLGTTFRPYSLCIDRKVDQGSSWGPQILLTAPLSSALSPPPRHAKRDMIYANALPVIGEPVESQPYNLYMTNGPLVARLSLDTEEGQTTSPIYSPSIGSYDSDLETSRRDEDLSSIRTRMSIRSNADRNASFLRPVTPHRSGTLGNASMRYSQSDLPDVPPLPTEFSKPLVTSNQHDLSDAAEDSHTALSLKERRRRRSPLSIPDNDRLTLSIRGSAGSSVYSEAAKTDSSKNSGQPKEIQRVQNMSIEEEAQLQLLHIDQSRQKAMSALEGKATKTVRMIPIANVHQIDGVLDKETQLSDDFLPGLERDKAQYDAVVAMHRRPCSPVLHLEDSHQHLAGPPNERWVRMDQDSKPQRFQSGDAQPTSGDNSHPYHHATFSNDAPEQLIPQPTHLLVPLTPPSSGAKRNLQLSPYNQTPSLVYYPSSPSSVSTVTGEAEKGNPHITETCIEKDTAQ